MGRNPRTQQNGKKATVIRDASGIVAGPVYGRVEHVGGKSHTVDIEMKDEDISGVLNVRMKGSLPSKKTVETRPPGAGKLKGIEIATASVEYGDDTRKPKTVRRKTHASRLPAKQNKPAKKGGFGAFSRRVREIEIEEAFDSTPKTKKDLGRLIVEKFAKSDNSLTIQDISKVIIENRGLTRQIQALTEALRNGDIKIDEIDYEITTAIDEFSDLVLKKVEEKKLSETGFSEDDILDLARSYPVEPLPEASTEIDNRPEKGFNWFDWSIRHYGPWIRSGFLSTREIDKLHPLREGETPFSEKLRAQLNNCKASPRNFVASDGTPFPDKPTDFFPKSGKAKDMRARYDIRINPDDDPKKQKARAEIRDAARKARSIIASPNTHT